MRQRPLVLAMSAWLAAAGCNAKVGSDPYGGLASDPCMEGNVRSTGQACVLPEQAISTDGQVEDWAGPAVIGLRGECHGACDVPLPVSLQMALHTSKSYGRALAVRIVLDGAAPQSDETVRYAVELRSMPAFAAPTVDTFSLSGQVRTYTKAASAVKYIGANLERPYAAAWTSDGLEAWVATALVGLRAGVSVTVRVDRQTAGQWRTVWAGQPSRGCWESDAIKQDPCDARAP
jgi:hypothetical protein